MYDGDKASSDKRLRIIMAATAVFSRKGFHEARVEEIAEEAEVGKGTVYEYFTSKKELFLEMIFYTHEQYQKRLERDVFTAETFYDRLQKLFRVTLQFMRQHKEMALILLVDHPLVGEDIHEVLLKKEQQELKTLSEMLLQEVQRGEIRSVNTQAAALAILGTLYLTCGQVMFYEYDQDPDCEHLSQEAIDILLHGLAPLENNLV